MFGWLYEISKVSFELPRTQNSLAINWKACNFVKVVSVLETDPHVNEFTTHEERKWPPFCRIYFQMNLWKLLYFDLKFNWNVFPGSINNEPVVVQIMAWRRTGDKPLSEPMMTLFTDGHLHRSASINYAYYCHMHQIRYTIWYTIYLMNVLICHKPMFFFS